MHKWMKCLKTGCDVRCGEFIYTGDLFYHDRVLVLAGVPKGQEARNGHMDFEVEEFLEIPTTGTFKVYLLNGKIEQVSEEFEKKLKDFLKIV